MTKIYEDFCERNCGHLKHSEKLCSQGRCYLKNFFDEFSLKIPQEIMTTLSDVLHSIRIKEEIKKTTRYGLVLSDVEVHGLTCHLYFTDKNVSPEEKIKLRALKIEELAILPCYKVFLSNPHIMEVKVKIAIENLPEITSSAIRERAIKLISPEGMAAIKRDWKNIWDFFRPVLTDSNFATRVRSFLGGYSDENPIGKPPTPGGWLGKVFP